MGGVQIEPAPREPGMTFYESVGGEETFRRLVAAFYAGVADDPELRALYPDEELGPAEERLRLFLIQFWGGPPDYHRKRGLPRLRARHAAFRIGPKERDAWLRHMRAAVDTLDLEPGYEQTLWAYLHQTAYFLTNEE
jgi:hemoglobin